MITDNGKEITPLEVVDLLNEQDAKINELQQLVEDMSVYIEKLGGWED